MNWNISSKHLYGLRIWAVALLCVLPTCAGVDETVPAILAAHAAVREHVGVQGLKWSPALAQNADRWARELILRNEFRHESKLRYGQNLFDITGGFATPAEAVEAWAGEASNYDPQRNQCMGMCGHYTQLVWHDTEYVGCGSASSAGRQVWVCDYWPVGNVIGERPF